MLKKWQTADTLSTVPPFMRCYHKQTKQMTCTACDDNTELWLCLPVQCILDSAIRREVIRAADELDSYCGRWNCSHRRPACHHCQCFDNTPDTQHQPPTHHSKQVNLSWTEPSIRRVSSSRVGLVVGKKPNPWTTHPVADLALEVAGGWWTRFAQIRLASNS